jgi:ABC-type multidrug transport system ATPase subunit
MKDNDAQEGETAVLRLEGLCKSYGETVALRDVSFTVDGGIVGLVGANGAGKSTLFRAIVDLIRADAGTIAVAGFDTQRQSLAARGQIGYLPEELQLYERLSGEELLSLTAALKGLDNPDERSELLAYFGLGQRGRLLIGEYSLGMRKKIGLAMALMGAPPLVLLDEPLNGLDTENMRRLRLRIEEMAQRGTTFLISSHVMSFVERICARVIVLRRGEKVADGSPDELRRREGMAGEPFEDVFLQLALGSVTLTTRE